MSSPAEVTRRPRLAVIFEDAGFSPLEIAEAARRWCDLIWVVRWSPIPLSTHPRLLGKLGEVLDVEGQEAPAMAKTLAGAAPDGIITFTDMALSLTADLGDRLGLMSHSRETAELLTDKTAQRTALRNGGVPVPEFASIPRSVSDVSAFCDELLVRFPAVAKPAQGSGSRDTFLIEDRAALVNLLRSPRAERFVLEEFLADRDEEASSLGAQMVSVESVVSGGLAHHLAVTGRFVLDPPFRSTGCFLPSDIAKADHTEVLNMATIAATALGVQRGVLHTEIKLTPDGPRIIEVNGRIGGGIPRMLKRVGGPDLLSMAMKLSLGEHVDNTWGATQSAVAFVRWIHGPNEPVTLLAAHGIDQVGQLQGVKEVRLNRQIGARLDPRDGGPGHIVALEGIVGSHAELRVLMDQIDSTLSISLTTTPSELPIDLQKPSI